MQAYSDLGNLAPVLSEMTLKGRPDYERAVRGLHWEEPPVYAVGSAATLPAAVALGYAFEDLLEWSVVVREAGRFLAGSLGTVRTGSVVVLIADESPEVIEAATAARKRGARVLGVTSEPAALAGEVQEMIVLPGVPGAPARGLAGACLQHAAAGYLALVAARVLKRPQPRLDRVEKDWAELPAHLDRAVSQFADAVRSLAAELRPRNPLFIVGGGLYHSSAHRAAALARREGDRPVVGVDPAEMRTGWLATVGEDSGAVFLSGSRSRWRKGLAELAREVKERGALSLALTDSNDHDLAREVRRTLLLPELAELPASILGLALAGWLAGEAAVRAPRQRLRGRAARTPAEAGKAASAD
ncbi:MAG TPA: SIS domain-containing protein [Terriglobia bacterium]|nr:SIS domain-containing protein [Terriglobia bacterium]